MIRQRNAEIPEERFMRAALRQAEKAGAAGEVPVGAVVVKAGRIIGRGRNCVEAKQDVTWHAEILALKQAAKRLKSWRLEGCDLYVTLEPCAMCAGAVVWSRIEKLYYGTADPKAGACGSVVSVAGNARLNHRPEIQSGILAAACQNLLKDFFHQLRAHKK